MNLILTLSVGEMANYWTSLGVTIIQMIIFIWGQSPEGIKALSSKLTHALALTDRRIYSTVMKSGLNKIHSKI